MNNTQRIIGKHALILVAKGQKEIAAQIFVYDHFREIRVDIEKLEVKILMDYDDSYFRVFRMIIEKEITKEMAVKQTLDFYNNVLNASMKLTKEEVKNIKEQRANHLEKMKKIKESKESKEV